MTRMSLTTFLYNDCVDSVARTTRLSKYADDPGGGDYHWAAKLGASKMFYDDMPYDQAVAESMSNMTRDYQRKDNQDALKMIHTWKLNHPGSAHAPPVGEIKGPQGELVVVLKPTFALEQKGVITAYVPWMFKDERLSPNVAGIGVHLLERGLKKGNYASWKFALIDTSTGKCFFRTHKHTIEAANFIIRTQEEILVVKKNRKAA